MRSLAIIRNCGIIAPVLIVLIIAGCSREPAWIEQYPDGYRQVCRSRIVYTDSDSWGCMNGKIIWSINEIASDKNGGVWAIKDWHYLLYSKDGNSFVRLRSPAVSQLNRIVCADSDTWAVGCYGSILHCRNGVCDRQAKGMTKKDLWEMVVNKAGAEAWAVGNEGLMMHYKTGKWTVEAEGLTLQFIHDIWMNQGFSEGWAVGNAMLILHFTNGRWEVIPHKVSLDRYGKPNDLMKVWINPSDTKGWAVGGNGAILRYNDGKWAPELTENKECEFAGVTMSEDNSEGWITGSCGEILHYKDSAWSSLQGDRDRNYIKFMGARRSDQWMVGGVNGIYHSSDGVNFETFRPAGGSIFDCAAGRGSNLWIGCWDDIILKIFPAADSCYPTLAGTRYRLGAGASGDSLAVDFRLTVKKGTLAPYLPVKFSLKGAVADSASYRDIDCTFARADTASAQGVWTAVFSLKPFGFPTEGGGQHKLKLKLTFRTANSNEDMTYDIREGNNKYLTLRR